MDFPLAQEWSLSRSQGSPKMSCIGNCIKKLWLRSANLYLAQRIFIWRTEFQNGFSFCMDVELIKLTYTLQRAARSNLFLVLFCSVLIFWIFWTSYHTEWNSKIDFPLAQEWSLSRSHGSPKMSCIGNCINCISYDSVPQICILRNGFLSGERNSLLDFPFAWMSN